MNKLLHLSLAAAIAVLAGCVAAPCPTPYPTGATTPPSFDRSWDAALGAAADVGIQVTSADRASGRISDVKAGAGVIIALQPQADNTLKLSFDAPASKESNPSLGERWAAAYNRRMGR